MGILALIAAAVLWGLIGPMSKILFNAGLSPLETAFWRGNIAGLAYLAHGLIARSDLPKNKGDIAKIILFGVFGVALLEGSYVMAVKTGGAALASVLLYSAPIWVNVSGYLFFNDRPPAKRWAALGLSFAGVAGLCLSGPIQSADWSALLWGLASGLSYAAFYIAGRTLFHRSSPVGVFMIAFPVASLALLPFILQPGGRHMGGVITDFIQNDPRILIMSLMMGLLSTYAAYLLYGFGLQKVGPGRASILTMLEPVVSVALAVGFFGESFTLAGYAFAALVIAGVALA